MWILSLITFPGVVAHEASHKFFCDWAGVRVLEVCYFRFGNPAGFVIHESPRKFLQSFFISVGPLILGVIVSFLFFLLFKRHSHELIGFVFAWLGLAIASQCFPSTGDAKALLSETWHHLFRSPFALLGLPAALLIWVVNKLNIFFFNYLFAVGLFWWVVYFL
ncbi:MAG: hypothetical protein HGA61_03380 [Candidatus Moranbacteria bacterium]|nr:hypothetical protein [Candidatus Moranbacteria bacterium]